MAKKTAKTNKSETEQVVERLRKITPKQIVEAGAKTGTVYGIVKGMSTIETPYGQSVKFSGVFQLTVETEEKELIYKSGTAFLPSVVEDELTEAFLGLDGLEGQNEVRFAIELFQKENEKSSTRYEWAFRHLFEMKTADPLDEIKSLVG